MATATEEDDDRSCHYRYQPLHHSITVFSSNDEEKNLVVDEGHNTMVTPG